MKQFRYIVSNSTGDIVINQENGFEPQIRRTNTDDESREWYQRQLQDLKTSLETLKAVQEYAVANANMTMTMQHYISSSSNNGYGNTVVEIVTFTLKDE